MEHFKLKSIDDLDLEFFSNINKKEEQASIIPEPVSGIDNSEPEFIKDEPAETNYFHKPAPQESEEPAFAPQAAPQEAPKKARPLVPIGQKNASYAPVGAVAPTESNNSPEFSANDYGAVEIDKGTKKSGGILAGKIISIVMLAVTLITFVFGCFISIFLDNNGQDIGGICFNTMSQDIESLGVSENDLIISKKVTVDEYTSGSLIAVPSSTLGRCDIQSISYVNKISTEEAEIATTAMSSNGVGYTSSVMSSACYGLVSSYIPALGGLLSFAIDNAILVCALFVLLSALWCLMLVLLEKSAKTATEPEAKKAKKEKKAK